MNLSLKGLTAAAAVSGTALICCLTGACQNFADACGDAWGAYAKPPQDAKDSNGVKASGKSGPAEGLERRKGASARKCLSRRASSMTIENKEFIELEAKISKFAVSTY